MNKMQLIDRVAERTQLTKVDVETVINAVIDEIKGGIRGGDDVTLMGFGTFTLTRRKARRGRNPRTGTEIAIPEQVLPKFRPGKDFRKLVEDGIPLH